MSLFRSGLVAALVALASLAPSPARGDFQPFEGVTLSHVDTTVGGRIVAYDLVDIDPAAKGIHFLVSPGNGGDPLDTNKQTVREFVTASGAQIGINGSFFGPPGSAETSGTPATVGGLAASNGSIYSPFSFAWDSLNIRADNTVNFLDADPGADTYNAIAGNRRLVRAGVLGTFTQPSDAIPDARTAFAVDVRGHILLLTVDGRNLGHSLGLTVPELAGLLLNTYNARDAINLDGGGSTTLVLNDGTPRVADVPVGIGGVAGTERPVANSLMVYAALRPVPEPGSWALMAIGAGGVMLQRHRRRPGTPAA